MAALLEEELYRTRIRQIRAYMKDFPEFNKLRPDSENSDEQIRLAIALTIDDYNATPPQIGSSVLSNFPSIYLLILGSILHLLQMEGLLQSRNKATYTAPGNISFNVSDKTPEYQNWLAHLKSDYEMKKAEIKKFLNADDGYSNVPSEYSSTQFWY